MNALHSTLLDDMRAAVEPAVYACLEAALWYRIAVATDDEAGARRHWPRLVEAGGRLYRELLRGRWDALGLALDDVLAGPALCVAAAAAALYEGDRTSAAVEARGRRLKRVALAHG